MARPPASSRRPFWRRLPLGLRGPARVRWGLFWGRRWRAGFFALVRGSLFMIGAMVLVAALLAHHATGFAWLGLALDPARATMILAAIAFCVPALASPRVSTWTNAFTLAAVYALILPVSKAVLDGPTLPIGSLGMDRRVDGVWFDLHVVLAVGTIGWLMGVASVLWHRFLRRVRHARLPSDSPP